VAAIVLGLSLAIGALVSPTAAHTFTKSDGNDSPGRLDIRSVSVSHKDSSVVHGVKTYEGWSAKSLGDDSFFIVGIDTNFDDDFERCAFILSVGRLRGSLTNCRQRFFRTLPVTKPSRTMVKVTIPGGELPGVYRWAVFSYWTGPPARCSVECVDAAPNRPPPILHDLTPPLIEMATDPLRVWESATMPDFVFPFSVSDAHTGVASWSVQSRPLGTTTWTTVSTGSGEGPQDPSFTGVAPGQYQYRVVVIDGHDNRTNGPSRLVYVPTDVDADTGPGTSVVGVDTADVTAYGGSYVALNELADSYTIVFDHTGGPCRQLELIGPGSGDWEVQVSDGVNPITTLQATDFDDTQRQTLYSEELCADATRIFAVTGGTNGSAGFGVDAVLL
jgi:hypothetical protein